MTYTNTKFIGDLHGNDSYKTLMTPGSIQLGDLDLSGYKDFGFDAKFQKRFGKGKRYFIAGNHDHFPSLKPDLMELQEVAKDLFYIPRGYISGKTLFIGGADSIDRRIRFPGFNWFPEEGMRHCQFERIMNTKKEIEVIVSHDCPESVFSEMIKYTNTKNIHFRYALDKIFKQFRPALWVFGHHHTNFDMTINSCRFVCVKIAHSVQFDIPLGRDIIA